MTYTQEYVKKVLGMLDTILDGIPEPYEQGTGPSWEEQVDAAMRNAREIAKHIHDVLMFEQNI
jgi:hypothetical protein